MIDVNEMVGLEIRIVHDAEQPTLFRGIDRELEEWRGKKRAVLYNVQNTVLLCDQ